MTTGNRNLIATMALLLTLALLVAAQQPKPTPPQSSKPTPAKPESVPALPTSQTPRVAPQPSPSPVAPQAVTPSLPVPGVPATTVRPAPAAPSQSGVPVISQTTSLPATPTARTIAPTPVDWQAEQADPVQTTKPTVTTAAPTAKEPEYVTEKFATKIIELKHASPNSLAMTLRSLGSGFKGARIDPSEDRKLLVVRDFPENIAAIEEAAKRLDVLAPPMPPKRDVELTLRVLVASNVEGASNDYTADLKEVVKQLQSTFNYKNYSLISSIVQRSRDGNVLSGNGTIQLGAPLVKEVIDVPYYFQISRLLLLPESAANTKFELRTFQYVLNPRNHPEVAERVGNAAITSDLSFAEGEKVVVGAASLKDKALILVVSAKVIK